ncbi:hypothetical protein Rs2_16189 [Raphanus sativus]|nr:hypothetical protein Rs2_16189 [Raphanus sativus]
MVDEEEQENEIVNLLDRFQLPWLLQQDSIQALVLVKIRTPPETPRFRRRLLPPSYLPRLVDSPSKDQRGRSAGGIGCRRQTSPSRTRGFDREKEETEKAKNNATSRCPTRGH